jgi:hypothetical protein
MSFYPQKAIHSKLPASPLEPQNINHENKGFKLPIPLRFIDASPILHLHGDILRETIIQSTHPLAPSLVRCNFSGSQLEPRTSQRLFGRVSVFNTVEARDESHGIIRHIPEQFVGGLVFPMMDALMASPFLP